MSADLTPNLKEFEPDDLDEAWGSSPVELLVEQMVDAWRRGETVTAEQIIVSHPELDDESKVRLIYEETCLRRESGLDTLTSEVVARFPGLRNELEILLHCDRLMRPLSPVSFPEVGESLGEFDLIDELGRGSSGRTFLASQPALGERPVVLKVMPGHLDEHLSLASLQHTHIVPLYSAQLFPDRGLRGLCMPYLGGLSLADILKGLEPTEPARRSGRDILAAIDRSRLPGRRSPALPGPFRRFLERASYVQAVCWLSACRADALQYAHDRGLVHMDVKPSNVLVADDGQPMLLDFHLARRPVQPGEAPYDRLGGTQGWMAPEHAEGIQSLREGQAIRRAIDGRVDIYALGLVIHRALGGPSPEGVPPRRLNQLNPRVSTGLADIVARALKGDPEERYASASQLADDLRRHLDDRPLRGVSNRSLTERWSKWRRRSPQGLTWLVALVSIMVAGVVAAAVLVEGYRYGQNELTDALADARRLREQGAYEEALRALDRVAQGNLSLMINRDEQRRAISDERLLSQRGLRARLLHDLAQRLRFRFGVEPVTATVEQSCRGILEDWSRSAGRQDSARLDEATEQRIAEDLDALRWAIGEAEASKSSESAGSVASPDQLGRAGRTLLAEGRFAEAGEVFRRVLEVNPGDFWSNYHLGVCEYRRGRFVQALEAFRICQALEPRSAECCFNRGLAFEGLSDSKSALREYTRALELNPRLVGAYLNRGRIHQRESRFEEAIQDFTRGLELRPPGELAASLYRNRALAYQAMGREPQARADLAEADRLGGARPEAESVGVPR